MVKILFIRRIKIFDTFVTTECLDGFLFAYISNACCFLKKLIQRLISNDS